MCSELFFMENKKEASQARFSGVVRNGASLIQYRLEASPNGWKISILCENMKELFLLSVKCEMYFCLL